MVVIEGAVELGSKHVSDIACLFSQGRLLSMLVFSSLYRRIPLVYLDMLWPGV